MDSLTKNDFCDLNHTLFMKEFVIVEVNKSVFIRSLTLKERVEIEKMDLSDTIHADKQISVLSKIISISVCDKAGNYLFDDDEGQQALNNFPAKIVQDLFAAIVSFNFNTDTKVALSKKK